MTEEIKEDLVVINRKNRGSLTIRMLLEKYNETHPEKLALGTLFRHCIRSGFYNVDSYLKPSLNEEQKIKRLKVG